MAFFSRRVDTSWLRACCLVGSLTVVSLIPLKTGGRRRNWRLYPWESVATTQGSVVQLPQQMRCCWVKRPALSRQCLPPPSSWGPGGGGNPDPSVPGVLVLWEPDGVDRVAQELVRSWDNP